jgi:ribosomal-protein-alanine N-acetyltransferase
MVAKKDEKKKPAETIGEMLKIFGNTVGEILDDPKVKATAKEFAASVVDAAAKFTESKVKKEEIRSKFRNVGKAAQTLGTSLDNHFKSAED